MKAAGKIKNARKQIVGMLTVIPCMVCLFSVVLPKLPASSLLRDSFWAHKVDAEPVYDIVFVGDSRVYRGIDPGIIESECHHKIKAFNYGFSSAGLDSFLLQRASDLLDPTGKKILVIGISSNSFLPGAIENEHLRSLVKWNRQDVWIKKNLYPQLTYFDAYSVSEIYKTIKGQRYFEQYHLESGFAESHKVPIDSGSALPAYKQQFRREPYSVVAEERFVQYIQKLKEDGVTVILTRMPVSHEMKKLEDSYMGSRLQHLRERLEGMGIEWIEETGNQFVTYDGSHLEGWSSRMFSSKLIQYFNL